MPMQTRTHTVTFLTPAFLGDAGQHGRWRTPPFKHLLREWWRVAWAAHHDPADWRRMREIEGRLFGHAWLEHDRDDQGHPVHARRSRVRLRLGRWDEGQMNRWPSCGRVYHPDVGKAVGADLYLGYGPLVYDKASKGTRLKANAAIQAGETNTLKVACPEPEAARIDHALALINAYGTLGSRSRNGWGSLELAGNIETLRPPLRDWRDCLHQEWPHAIGEDSEGPLIWRTEQTFADWQMLMKELARIKIGLRTQFKFPNEKPPHPRPRDRHWLSYPVTHHAVRGWGNNRLPNSLRFKVRRDENGRLYGVIFHMPCKPPGALRPNHHTLESVWRQVHEFLSKEEALTRSDT